MIIAQLPSDEELRLLDLASLGLLDSAAEKEFDEIVELAGYMCNCPVSLISLVDKDRQWFKAKQGTALNETERRHAFCSHAILQDDIMIVNDASLDQRFFDNPLVTANPNVRFYAGAPIISPAGFKIGTLCIFDNRPREITPEQTRALSLLSSQVTKLLEIRTWNRIIKQRANELLSLKDEAVRQSIQEQDVDKRNVSAHLHENLAQVLAAARMFLSLAEQNETLRLSLIKSTNDQLGELLVSICSLSNSIAPVAISSLPMEDLLGDYIKQTVFPFTTRLRVNGATKQVEAEQSIHCIRMVEKWLELLKQKKGVKKVDISLILSDTITLIIEDDGLRREFKEQEQDVIVSTIYDRVQSLEGALSFSESGENRLEIILPLEINMATTVK